MEHYWGKNMSETRSITYNLFNIKEPINTISSIIGILYILNNYNKNIFLKNIIIFNLICATIAHSTYNNLAIELDGLSLVIPVLAICFYYMLFIELSFLCLLFIIMYNKNINTKGLIFINGLLIIFYNKSNSIVDFNKFKNGLIICFLSFIARLLDETYPNYWIFYLHAIWHIFMTIGLVYIIDSIQW